MTFFTQPEILQQIGHKRLAKFLSAFDQEIKAANLLLPVPAPEEPYFSELAILLSRVESLPPRLHQELLTLEAAASPENDQRVRAALKQRIPHISVSQHCALDRALELWFAARDELAPFTPPLNESCSSRREENQSPKKGAAWGQGT